MRFLLLQASAKSSSTPLPAARRTTAHAKDAVASRAWGQQCSPNCGCALRLDCTLSGDSADPTVVNATYDARTVATTRSRADGTLLPQFTSVASPRGVVEPGRVLLTECRCQTLHALAAEATKYLRGKKLSTLRNETEFASVRSGAAFRHTVLKERGLLGAMSPSTSGSSASFFGYGCYDLVEEAFLALVRGHMPSPRRGRLAVSPLGVATAPAVPSRLPGVLEEDDMVRHRRHLSRTQNDDGGGGSSWVIYGPDDAEEVPSYRLRQKNRSDDDVDGSSLGAAYVLRLLDVDSEEDERADYLIRRRDEEVAQAEHMDWVSYVDELYRSKELEEEEDEAESA